MRRRAQTEMITPLPPQIDYWRVGGRVVIGILINLDTKEADAPNYHHSYEDNVKTWDTPCTIASLHIRRRLAHFESGARTSQMAEIEFREV